MPVILLVFEFLGTTELLVIALVALLIFGPRKLPEIGRTIGRSLAEFKRASEDFKRMWEYEVEMERSERDSRVEQGNTIARAALPEGETYGAVSQSDVGSVAPAATEEQTVARGLTEQQASEEEAEAAVNAENSVSGSKKDWL